MAKITGNADQDSDGYGALYGGPRSGPPQDDATDLHDNPNPFAAGSPHSDLSGTSAYPIGALPGYYMNPAPDPINPNRDGAGLDPSGSTAAADNIAAGLDAIYADVLGSRAVDSRTASDDAAEPHASNMYNDQGYGPTGTGRS